MSQRRSPWHKLSRFFDSFFAHRASAQESERGENVRRLRRTLPAIEQLESRLVPTDNHLPVAIADNYVAASGGTLSSIRPTINDTDEDGDVLSAVITAQPQHGMLYYDSMLSAYSYSPNYGYVGSDTFRYKAFDGIG